LSIGRPDRDVERRVEERRVDAGDVGARRIETTDADDSERRERRDREPEKQRRTER
jgi:hypothetical protein